MNELGPSNPKRLTPAECAVVITIAILSKAGTPTTPKEIANYLKEDVQTVRNILERLRNKGLVISSLAFGLGGLARISLSSQVSGRERIHKLVDDIKNILQRHPEIKDWAKVSLGTNDENELLEYINKRAEEKRLESYGLRPSQLAAKSTATASPVVPYDRTPLHIAALWGDVEIVEVLLERGADPNVKDDNGQTPLHIAAQEGHVDVVRVLLERGADPRIADNGGHIPLDYAKDSTIRSLLESAMRSNELRNGGRLQGS